MSRLDTYKKTVILMVKPILGFLAPLKTHLAITSCWASKIPLGFN